jgi:glycerol-3-phosphate dehydrogenase
LGYLADPSARERLEPDHPFTRGEIVHAVRVEGARTLEDLIWRRTYRAFLGPLDAAARQRWEDALRLGLSG